MHRMTRYAITMVLVAIVFGVAAQAAETKYGAGVSIATATSIKELYASPEKFVGKTLRVDGIVTAVCTEMGCWLALGAADNPDQAVRFQADHDGKIVFPLTLKGKQASAEGVFIKIAAGDKEATEAAGEHAASQPKAADFGRRYQFQVTGAVAP
jgi:putative intracellular protease/amidase